jgi:hypothetical protein
VANDLTMLPGWEEELLHQLHPAFQGLGDEMLAGAISATPVSHDPDEHPGLLRESNYAEVDDACVITLGNHADYAYFVEHGHQTVVDGVHGEYVEAEPFLRPQVYRSWGEI